MNANWNPELPRLRAAMAAAGAILPAAPTADGRWHECAADSGVSSGRYWLSPVIPPVALYRPRGQGILTWRPDDRLLPSVVRERLTSAAALCPRERNEPDGLPRPPEFSTLPPICLRRRRRGEVKTWLRELLAEGPIPALRVVELAKQRGFSTATLRRASDELDVAKVKDGFAAAGLWYWRLGRDPVGP